MEVNYVLLYFLYFRVSMISVDFTLTTKVQVDGDVLIVGLDDYGRELFKLYMNEGEDADQSTAKEYMIGTWHSVDDESS